MVRHSKQTSKDTHKKKTPQQDKPSLKKPAESTVWPCRINGCNKQFAREADLKRHQRTTKLHSVPGFACPQCDARFTRTDALRRHQKSRHNGVVIEPTDAVDRRRSMADEGPHSSGSRSKSRSRTPSSKDNPPPSLPPSTALPGPPQSYYRHHTFTGVVIPSPAMTVDGHYSPAIGLPTSSTRLHQATWPPWVGDGSHPPAPHMMPPGYAPPYYNPPPYYRPGSMMHPPDMAAHQSSSNGSSSNDGSSSSRIASPIMAVDPSLDHTAMEDSSEPGDPEGVIDPLLVSPPGDANNGVASPRGQASRAPEAGSPPSRALQISSPSSAEPQNEGADEEAAIVHHLLSPGQDHPYSSPGPAPPLELEQILTEDGEPMLNPAELLTQESLASPPPS